MDICSASAKTCQQHPRRTNQLSEQPEEKMIYQQISTNINQYQQLPTIINKLSEKPEKSMIYQQISTIGHVFFAMLHPSIF